MSRSVFVVGDGDFSFSREVAGWIRERKITDPSVGADSGSWGELQASVFLRRDDVVKRYMANNSPIADNLRFFKTAGIRHFFGVDATDLEASARWSSHTPCDTIIWTYPFPESNSVDIESKHSLIRDFFESVRRWNCFAASGIVVLGLKSCSDTRGHVTADDDYQFKQWHIAEAANACNFQQMSSFGPVSPFWHPTHVSGRPLCKKKEREAGQISIKFYAFQQQPRCDADRC